MRISGGGKAAAAAGLFARQEAPSALRPYLLDSLYLGGLLAAIPYLLATGKGRQVLDHVRRRARDIAPRAGDRPCAWIHGVSVGEILSARRLSSFT